MPEPSPAAAGAFTLGDFDFELPPELIAQQPAAERSGSRLLDASGDTPVDRRFRELPSLLRPGDLLVFNDTRVVKARLLGVKPTGGAVEALVERFLPGDEVLAQLRASKSPRPGMRLRFLDRDGADGFEAEVLGRGGPAQGPPADASLYHLRFPAAPLELLERFGHVPLPPYIRHADGPEDEHRYQTVFADKPGAIAAPTAALHFDAPLLQALAQAGVASARITLHVGAGTFQPVRCERIADHRMHSEWFDVPQSTVDAVERAQAAGGRLLAVGTTTLRALESAALGGRLQAGSRDTDIFITPGFEFRVVDLLLTNFHLPKSTLMMLVAAFTGHAPVMALYRHAIAQRYRFFSYGDAMLLGRTAPAASSANSRDGA